MLAPEDAEIGRTVWLRPNTKTASKWCHLRLPAEIVSYTEWPIVQVHIEPGKKLAKMLIRVHRLDIALNPAKGKQDRQGDSAHQSGAVIASGRPAYRPYKPIDLPEGWEEQPLF